MLRPLFEFAFARHFERSETASSPRFMRRNLSFLGFLTSAAILHALPVAETSLTS